MEYPLPCRRTYTPSELRAMTKPFAEYDWEIGVQRARHNPTRICYLIGVPSANAQIACCIDNKQRAIYRRGPRQGTLLHRGRGKTHGGVDHGRRERGNMSRGS